MTRTAGAVLLLGAAVFLTAAFAPTSRVFTMTDPYERLRFLEQRAVLWRRVQPLFGGGAVISGVGLFALGLSFEDDVVRGCILVAGMLAVVGAVPWAQSCRLRGRRIVVFAHGGLPGWHYQVYVWFSLLALALTGLGLLASTYPPWVGWFDVGATAVFALALLRFGDLPPFLLYLPTIAIGCVALSR